MTTLTAFLALGLLGQASNAPRAVQGESFTARLAGRDVKFDLSSPEPTPLPEDVLSWDGWKFAAAGRQPLQPVQLLGPSEDLVARWKAAKEKQNEATPVWRTKLYLITKAEWLRRSDSALLMRRESVDRTDIDGVLKEIARFQAYLETALNGAAKVEFDVEIDEQPIHVDSASPTAIQEWAAEYLRCRINGVGFQADDRVYRGPYASVTVVYPNVGAEAVTVNEPDAPSFVLAPYPPGPRGLAAPDFASHLLRLNTLLATSLPSGIKAEGLSGGFAKLDQVVTISATGADFDAAQVPQIFSSNTNGDYVAALTRFQSGSATPNVVMSVKPDSERGTVLSYLETGWHRGGVFASPAALPGGQFLQFWAKTSAEDPVSLHLLGGSAAESYVLAPREVNGAKTASLPNDGQWHRVVLPLPTGTTSFAIGAPTHPMSKHLAGPVEVLFDDFEVVSTPEGQYQPAPKLTPTLESAVVAERIAALSALTQDSAPEALTSGFKLLSDHSDLVRLYAANVFTRVKFQPAEASLIAAIRDLNTFVSEEAMQAVAFQGTPEGLAAIRRSLDLGQDDARRAVAARILGEQKDPKLAGPISTVIGRRYRGTKIEAVKALGLMPGEQASLVMTAFLNQDDPQVRLEVIRQANLKVPQVRRQVLYTAVNDFSDYVRATSYLRLLHAEDPPTRAEGAKGVRDEGVEVRLRVVKAMAETPNEEFRNALRTAVVDASPRVRAAAIRSLGALPKGVTTEEIANTLNDSDPRVQLALLEIAEKNGFKLPPSTIKAMEGSKFGNIAQRAAKLPR